MATKSKAMQDGRRIAAAAMALINAGADKDAVLANLRNEAEAASHLAGMTTTEKWNAGYRQHPDTKEWLPRDQVVAIVAAKAAAKAAKRVAR